MLTLGLNLAGFCVKLIQNLSKGLTLMLKSMTGYASAETIVEVPASWSASWELRGVNAKGLDIRTRVPDWVPGLEAVTRKLLSADIGRGSVSLSLRLRRTDSGPATINAAALDAILAQIAMIEAAAEAKDIDLAPTTALDLLQSRSITVTEDLAPEAAAALSSHLIKDIPSLLKSFLGARSAEGAALTQVIDRQLSEIEGLVAASTLAAKAREPNVKAALAENMKRIMHSVDADPGRIAQELALLAVKADITEELDRLQAHCLAARYLLQQTGPVGRKFDFLCQEFNREANTLCSKSGDADLTRIGLALKTVIDQLREQIQNVE
jgi:uncharacterized protein (TIGR00255 family)